MQRTLRVDMGRLAALPVTKVNEMRLKDVARKEG